MKSGFAEEAMRALIADSDRQTLDNINIAFSICLPDWKLLIADSSKKCLGMIKDNSLDLVILGDLFGISNLDIISQVRHCSEAPVLVLSSISDEPILIKAFECGADGYMVKPFHQFELMARIRTLLKGKQCNNQHVYYQPKEI